MELRLGEPDNFTDCKVIFSATPNDVAGRVEALFAAAGYYLFTNAGPHRMDADVPLMITDVNPDHAGVDPGPAAAARLVRLYRGQRQLHRHPSYVSA